MAAMENNRGITDRVDRTDLDGVEATLAEVESLIASLAELDPAEAAEPGSRIAEHLGALLEAEDDRS